MNSTVSILAELPKELHESLKSYLDCHPDWDQDRVFAAALSSFLLQNGTTLTEDSKHYRPTARVYFDSLFKAPAATVGEGDAGYEPFNGFRGSP